MISRLSIFTLLSVVATVLAQTGPEVASYFRETLSNASAVYLPSKTNYTLETTQRWNAFSAPTYLISVKPTTDLDVQKIVRQFVSSIGPPGQDYKNMPLTVLGTDRICLSSQHLIPRHRRWARLLSNSGYNPERDWDRPWPFQHRLHWPKC